MLHPHINQNLLSKIEIRNKPHRTFKANLQLPNTKDLIEDVNVSVFNSELFFKLDIIHNQFQINISSKKSGKVEIPVEAKFIIDPFKSLSSAKKVFEFFSNWLKNTELLIEDLDNSKILRLPLKLNTIEPKIERSLKFNIRLLDNLILIQNYFKRKINLPELISNNDIEAISKIRQIIESKSVSIESLSFELVNYKKDYVQSFISKKYHDLRIQPTEKIKIEFFNYDLIMDCKHYEIRKAIIKNKSAIIKALKRGSEKIKFKVGNAEKALYFEYNKLLLKST